MKGAAPILNPILLALLLAVSVMPIVNWQLRKGWSRGLAITLSVLVITAIGTMATTLVGLSGARLVRRIPVYEARLIDLNRTTLEFLSTRGIDLSDLQSLEVFKPASLVKFAVSFLGNIMSTFGNSVLVLLLVIFLLIEISALWIKHDRGQLPADSWFVLFSKLGSDLRKYVSITALTGLITAIGNVLLLLILGVPFPFLWGFLSFMLNFIPNIGFIISVAPPALLALLELGGIEAVIIVVGFILINAFVENVLKTRFMG
jgi:predicted PurR-regulated permease PerM